ncbi:hypothetical protein ACLOJK_030250 [Asimina triloba]
MAEDDQNIGTVRSSCRTPTDWIIPNAVNDRQSDSQRLAKASNGSDHARERSSVGLWPATYCCKAETASSTSSLEGTAPKTRRLSELSSLSSTSMASQSSMTTQGWEAEHPSSSAEQVDGDVRSEERDCRLKTLSGGLEAEMEW